MVVTAVRRLLNALLMGGCFFLLTTRDTPVLLLLRKE